MQETLTPLDRAEYLSQLREVIPFLQEIPDDVYFFLDTSEFYLPLNEIAEARVILESQLGHFIMTYKRDVFNLEIPVERHLCANIKGAALLSGQLDMLQEYESEYAEHNVSFVAYQNPLELISPRDSVLQQFYEDRGLVLK